MKENLSPQRTQTLTCTARSAVQVSRTEVFKRITLCSSLALPATSALCIASHRKAMSHSRSDAEGACVCSLWLILFHNDGLRNKARGRILLGSNILLFDHLRGRQGNIGDRFKVAFLQIDFLRFGFGHGVYPFSFSCMQTCQVLLETCQVLGLKKYSVHPNWDER